MSAKRHLFQFRLMGLPPEVFRMVEELERVIAVKINGLGRICDLVGISVCYTKLKKVYSHPMSSQRTLIQFLYLRSPSEVSK